jgi:hypothetical protein
VKPVRGLFSTLDPSVKPVRGLFSTLDPSVKPVCGLVEFGRLYMRAPFDRTHP